MRGLFDDEEAAVADFFAPRRHTGAPEGAVREKPTHYSAISATLYTEDLQRLAGLVAELKKRGYSRANKSLVIREALRQMDLDLVPPQR